MNLLKINPLKTGSGIRSIAMKVCSEELENKKRLVLDVLGGKEVYAEPGLVVLQLQDGSLIELYGPGSSHPDFLFEKNDLVLSFLVGDMEQALANMVAAGVEVISGVQRLGACTAYCYIRDKKGTIFGLTA
jgi:hypothetical protein